MAGSKDTDQTPGKGLLDSRYARNKKALMATVNQIRATGAAIDVE